MGLINRFNTLANTYLMFILGYRDNMSYSVCFIGPVFASSLAWSKLFHPKPLLFIYIHLYPRSKTIALMSSSKIKFQCDWIRVIIFYTIIIHISTYFQLLPKQALRVKGVYRGLKKKKKADHVTINAHKHPLFTNRKCQCFVSPIQHLNRTLKGRIVLQ